MTLPFGITALVTDAANRYGIDEFLLVSQVIQESGGNPSAVRYEPGYRWLWPSVSAVVPVAPCSLETERILQMCSWGLLQIMGAVARERGFKGAFLADLAANPALALDLGAQHLALKISRYANIRDALSAYNAGSPTPNNFGKYVDPIMERADALREQRA
jgi:soluble lytic murein transglycosylase-like protein